MDDAKQVIILFGIFSLGVILGAILVVEKHNEALLDILVKRSPTCYETSR
jgi:hypothetical protein